MSEPVTTDLRFVDMGIGGKLVYILKLCVFLLTFGFAFPTILSG
jgi:hypothetical protein